MKHEEQSFIQFLNTEKWVQKRTEVQMSFLKQPQGVWKLDETFFEVFDIASQTINNSWRNSKYM